MLPVSVVLNLNGLHGDVRVKGVLVEHNSTTSIMGNVEVIREALVLKILNLQWHLLCLEVQDFKMLKRVCSSKRLGTLLSKRHTGLGKECLRSWAPRKTGEALPALTKWRNSVELGSDPLQVA